MTIRKTRDEQIEIEYKRQQTIEKAVEAAERIILDQSDGSIEETNYLTYKVAESFFMKLGNVVRTTILRKDLGL